MRTIVFFGDSITAGNRSLELPLGDGFVSMVKSKIDDALRLDAFEIINSGINGHTVQDLLKRVRSDVSSHEPDMVVIKIGINDAYNDYISVDDPQRIMDYRNDFITLIRELNNRQEHIQLLLLTPYYITDTPDNELYKTMSRYRSLVLLTYLNFLTLHILGNLALVVNNISIYNSCNWPTSCGPPIKRTPVNFCKQLPVSNSFLFPHVDQN